MATHTQPTVLEDDFNDVLKKAIIGSNISVQDLSIDQAQLKKCLSGEMNQSLIKELAPLLNLNSERLLKHPEYYPDITIPANTHLITTAFGYIGVNAYIVETDRHLLIFDTGTEASTMIEFIKEHPEKKPLLFITHHHPDHIACLDALLPWTGKPQTLEPNSQLHIDNITLTALDVAGHFTPANAYYLTGLPTPICVVGDAIFAGSIGKCLPQHYQMALSNINNNLLSLPHDTILCPGHGPLTTGALEKENNPFFSEHLTA